ncbi:lytic murein transglycosylase [Oharaeibacter diazotrophicus]|uniref:Lytic murein transglycosylase n=1 Tax=Oharaeibacter diazotrophicus TaxID=1920512 RepID=A0A4R6R6G9_9HYPH|nr:lytic murein transglycosylase [Oharaeibacter diazotrophicus]TDP81432.1 lytic murein transglycosylase [Oharaeibacter diazotrophicus]BBE73670.1 membrane-bound lytic murein transglycosylase B precursor [Pleomorphomonas sp. SM30]GLS75459.1 lytic transglycosylase [Oharaeibacter diazotrophicus]
MFHRTFLAAALLALAAAPATAASCGNDAAGFPAWLDAFQGEAVAAGIAPGVAASALGGLSYSKEVIRLDRGQKGTFKVDFATFAAKRVTKGRLVAGKKMLRTHADLLAGIERRYGVQPEVLVAIWGMETDYGAVRGKMPVIRSLATLAYDCRRSDFFRNELLSALTIIQRGDKSPADLVGAWAGEIGQTQFLASNYLKYSVDYDGNGRRDLIRSVPDVLASTANLLKSHGWSAGADYAPGGGNFPVLAAWNKSDNYQRAIALMAGKLLE